MSGAVLLGRSLHVSRSIAQGGGATAVASALHLARELVRADGDYVYCVEQCLWDHAEAWHEYRERLQSWRFDVTRGHTPADLQVCPRCGGVQQLVGGLVRCFACGEQWVTR